MAKKPIVICLIQARGGSKRIRNKNIRNFCGKPLIAYTIAQAKALSFVDRTIVDTDSPDIARIAKRYGAEVPFLRPEKFATDTSPTIDSHLHLLKQLKGQGYVPDYILLLPTTTPLREVGDVEKCWKKMQKGTATTVLTVAPTHQRLYTMTPSGRLVLANRMSYDGNTNKGWPKGYKLNGCFAYIIKIPALLKEKTVFTKHIEGIVCPAWRSVDLDNPEDWVLAEFLFKNRRAIERAMHNFKQIQ